MKFPILIGIRYLRAKRREQFLSLISMIALVAMMLGVVALIVVLSVMNGFEHELRDRILTLVPHASIELREDVAPKSLKQNPLGEWQGLAEQLAEDPAIVGVAPFIRGEAMLSLPGKSRGVQLTAIDPERELQVSVVDDFIIEGDVHALQAGKYQIVLGALVARQLSVWVGDSLTLTVPKVSITPAGVFPRSRRFQVAAIFEVGAQLDGTSAFIHIEDGGKLFRMGSLIHGLRIKTHDIFGVDKLVPRIEASLPDSLHMISWRESQSTLFSAVKMEKTMIGLLLFMVVAVAAFNIVSILSMMVADKTMDIAVLRTMGASPAEIMGIFIVQGMGVGFVGAFAGGLLGVLVAPRVGDIVHQIEQLLGLYVFDPDVFFITKIPSVLLGSDVLVILSGALILSFLATLYPAYHASKITPAQALRYD